MDQSDPATPDTSMEAQNTTNRRKSGRAVQAPVLLSNDPSLVQSNGISGKRKRIQVRGGDATGASDEEDDDSEEEESDPDEEEVKERRKKASKKATPKPAPKKPKTAGPAATKLAVRPATNGTSKPSRPRKPKGGQAGSLVGDGTGLYGKWSRAIVILHCVDNLTS